MKLFFATGTCSLSPHIALLEAGLPFALIKVNNSEKTTSDGRDYKAINPLGYVPALELDDGTILREGAILVQYIADQVPAKNLAPAFGTMARYRLMEWLNFIASEVHKGFGPLWNRAATPEQLAPTRARLDTRLKQVEALIGSNPFVMGTSFSVADCYLFAVLSWSTPLRVELPAGLQKYLDRIAQRPTVQAAIAAEKSFGNKV